MRVSVIIPTYNGAGRIGNVVQCLSRQTHLPDEVIVVIDGSTDHTKEVVRALAPPQFRIRIIEQENRGRAHVRNTGGHAASGDLLIFFDDDMLPEPTCVAEHVAHHRTNPGSIVTGPQVNVIPEGGSDIMNYKNYLSHKWSAELVVQEARPLPLASPFITAANFSISRQLFMSLGGFDQRLLDAEDYDLAVRAQRAGIALYYRASALAWHNEELDFKSFIRRQRQYTVAHQALLALKPELYRENRTLQKKLPSGIKGFVFRCFAHPFWIWLADSNLLSGILPQKMRFRLYDLIVTANGSFFSEKVHL